MLKLLGLDLDGTLIYQDREFFFNAFERTCNKFGIRAVDTDKLFEEYRQLSRDEFFKGTDYNPNFFNEFYKKEYGGFDGLVLHTNIFPEVKEVLEEFRRRDIGLFLATNANSFYKDIMLNKFNLKDYFNGGIYTRNIIRQKAFNIFRALVDNKVLPSNTAYVGDLVFDVRASKRVSVLDVLIKRPGAIVLDSENLNPSITVSSLEELIPEFTARGLL
mgnify:CR=1 FL=1